MSDPAPRPQRTAAIITLGCKLNIADSEAMARRLREEGWLTSDRAQGADAVIVNTCSVTHVADRKSRHSVRLARRQAPGATVALTGCLLETASAETVDRLGADLVYRQGDQAALVERLRDARWPELNKRRPLDRAALRTRAFVAAQQGCDDVCAFCIVPRTRGRERSRTIDAIVGEVLAREAEGVNEVVITGTQLGAYGRDRGVEDLQGLLAALLERTAVPRIRMSSIQPQDVSEALVGLWQDKRLCRHFHLALQSGSDAVLRRMRRRYTTDEYRSAVEMLRRNIADVALTTDVIAGFPGETDDEFEETYRFCRDIGFSAMHVFPYSVRTGTLAAKMPGQVDEATKRERVRRLIELGEEMSLAYRSRFVGSETEVLWERAREAEGMQVWEGLTDTYVRVFAASDSALDNRITPVLLVGEHRDGLWGR